MSENNNQSCCLFTIYKNYVYYFQVRLAKESKQKSRSHSFDVMNRDKRQFVHELSDHFGIESESYDAEPKRNVVATGTSSVHTSQRTMQ